MIGSALAYLWWMLLAPVAALFTFVWALVTGNIMPLYHAGTWIASSGIRLSGVHVRVEGLDALDPCGTYVFMSNHASNLDPPILVPLIPRRTSVLVKKELYRIPIFGTAMRLASLVPVDRTDREKAIESLREGEKVLLAGINMMVFVEGTRSPDGRLLPFKKGPFYLAMESRTPIVPVTIIGTHQLQPKGQMFWKSGEVRIVFHRPIDCCVDDDRDALIAKVRDAIASALPSPRR